MSPFRRIAAGVAVAAIAIFATAVPASAHDTLISSTPSNGEQLGSPPESIVMTFSADLIVLDSSTAGAEVLVVDESGRDWVADVPDVQGDTVTVPLSPGMPEAGYQVRWQVVSSDGHPISGIIPFTIGDAEPMRSGNAPATPDEDASDASDQGVADQDADGSSGPGRVLLIGAAGAVVAVAAYALYRFLRRPRAAAGAPNNGDSSAEQD